MKTIIPDSRFSSRLLELNHLACDFAGWLFLPGMNFEDRQFWWKDLPRLNRHEGLDLLFFRDHSGKQRELPPQFPVPPILDGEVVAVFGDFLGSTMAVRHAVVNEQGWELVSLYGHVRPLAGCGSLVIADTPLAEVAGGKARRVSDPPDHLHLSLGWLKPSLSATELNWPALWTNPGIRLIDPLPVIQPAP